MIFLFVGSSGLTEASFPRDLAIPQLLLSSACVILLPMKASQMTVFLHRGLSPLQLTPMSGAHHALQRTRRGRRGCNRCVPCAGSLSSWAVRRQTHKHGQDSRSEISRGIGYPYAAPRAGPNSLYRAD